MKKCWRKEVAENLQRLHSLLFGVERALDQQNRDFSSAYLLSLRLIGFIDSRSQSEIDQVFLQQTRCQALTYLHTAKQSLTPIIDR
jgi:Gpi18-like mannosyltransferase